jgi:hypothetical protein
MSGHAEVYIASREAQSKYTYYLLAVVGACLAFALNQTRDARMSLWQIPLAAAVVSWLASFLFGCFHLHRAGSALYANCALFSVSDDNPDLGNNPFLVEAASAGIRDAMEHHVEKAKNWSVWQFWMLVAGGLFYIVWHVVEMWLRTAFR